MKYIKKLLLISSVILFVPEASHSAAAIAAAEDLGPPARITRQQADGILRLKIDPIDILTNPDIGNTVGTIHIIDGERNTEIERKSEHLIRILNEVLFVNAENKILGVGYEGGIDIQDYLRILFCA